MPSEFSVKTDQESEAKTEDLNKTGRLGLLQRKLKQSIDTSSK